jgi:hypothetical protein
MKSLRGRLSYANVMATIAVFAALGTGGAYAATKITGAEVVDESLTDADIKNGSLAAAIADQSISAFKLAGNSVWGGQGGTILDNSVSGYDVAESTLGKVPAASAADTATTAQNATTAGSATTAQKATTADSAPIKGYEVISYTVPTNGTDISVGTVSCPLGKHVLGGTYRMYHPDYANEPYILERAMTRILGNNSQFRVIAKHPFLDGSKFGPSQQPYQLVIQVTCAEIG